MSNRFIYKFVTDSVFFSWFVCLTICFVSFLSHACTVLEDGSASNTTSFLGMFTILWKMTISFIVSVCPSVRPSVWNNSAPTRWIFIKFNTWLFFKNLCRKFKFHKNLTRITGTLHGDQYTFLITSCSVLLRIRNISDKSYRENQSTHFMCNNLLFLPKIMLFIS